MAMLKRKQYSRAELEEKVKDIFRYFNEYRKPFEKKAIKNYKAFVGHKEEVKGNKSNLHIPKTYEIVDTIRARILSSFFHQRPYIEFTTKPEMGDDKSMAVDEEKAEIAAALVDEQLEKNNIYSVFYDFITSFMIFPAGYIGIAWRYESEVKKRRTQVPEVNPRTGSYTGNWTSEIVESEEITWDDNEIFNIDFFDFWGDPDRKNVEDSRAVFHREFPTKKEIKERLKSLNKLDEGKVFDVDLDSVPPISAKEEKGKFKRLNSIGISSSQRDPFKNSKSEGFGDKEEIELMHYWEDDRHIMMVNRDTVIYDGPNPYWRHGEKPFVKATYDKLPNEFYGMSGVDLIYDMQEEVNSIHNQRMDNVNMMINNMWKVLKGSDLTQEDLVSEPNGVIEVDNMDSLQLIETGEIPQSAFMSEDKLIRNLQNTLGTPANIRGSASNEDQSATETQIVAQSAQTRFGAKIRLFEKTGIYRMAKQMDLNNQQFITDERAVRLDPEDRNNWQAVDPGELIGEFDYSPATSSSEAAANKELRREQLTEIIGFLMQSQVPFINYKKLIEEWLSEFDIENPEKFMIPEKQFEIMRRHILEQETPQENVPADSNDLFSMAGNGGGLGQSQVKSPNRRSGGLTAQGQPKPQPGQRGG